MTAADLPSQPDGPSSSQPLSHIPSQSDLQHQDQQQQHIQQHSQQHSQQPSHQQLDRTGEGDTEQLNEVYNMEVAEMRHRLRHSGAQPVDDQFSSAEMLRHARACGLMKVVYLWQPTNIPFVLLCVVITQICMLNWPLPCILCSAPLS